MNLRCSQLAITDKLMKTAGRGSTGILMVIMLVTIFAQVPTSFGISLRSREEFGTIQAIDLRTRRLAIKVERDAKQLALVWGSSTSFIEGSHFTTVDRLQRGMQVTVYYRSPFFGERYATKILVNNRFRGCRTIRPTRGRGGNLNRSICDQNRLECLVSHCADLRL